MAQLTAYEVAYRAHFVSLGSNEVRPDHRDHEFEDCPAWPQKQGQDASNDQEE